MAILKEAGTHEIVLVVPDDGLLLEVAGLTDIFSRANRRIPERSKLPRYSWRVASTSRTRTIHGSSGLKVSADTTIYDLDPLRRWDTVLVTGNGGSARHGGLPAAAEWLRLASRKAGRMASVCAGAFLLGEAGLLEGRRATTHWRAMEEFEHRFPDTIVEPDSIYVRDGKVFTSAGASAGLDLALAFVEMDLGPDIARDVARDMVLYLRRPGGQSQFSAALQREARSTGPVRDLQRWILDHLDGDLRVEPLAEKMSMSVRNFARVFQAEVGVAPARYVEELRIEEAKRRLQDGADTVDCIAQDCGMVSALNLRRAFLRQVGVSPSEYRERFGRI